jgi:folylpolyglutamate synthase/dihydropteroate synthase
MNLTLYQLSQEYKQQLETLADLDLSPEVVQDTLESLGGELQTKAQNTVAFMRHLESLSESIKLAEAQMELRRVSIERRVQQLKDYVLISMQDAGIHKIESPYFVVSVAKNPPSVEVYNQEVIPMEFMKTPPAPPPSPDKKAIIEAMKSGVDVAGCRLRQGVRLSIK